ncbi:MAG: hypothetical protein ACYDEJ_05070 [Desulfitobacteriaceae bacterium]
MLFGSPFGVPFSPIPSRLALFDAYPIGTRLGIGADASFWVGSFGGIQDGVALLTNAQLFANMGKPIDGSRPVVRIPISQITFVSQ